MWETKICCIELLLLHMNYSLEEVGAKGDGEFEMRFNIVFVKAACKC